MQSPYIWKQLGTDCRNLPQVHTIVRMIRMITEIVCPGVVLLGEVVMGLPRLSLISERSKNRNAICFIT